MFYKNDVIQLNKTIKNVKNKINITENTKIWKTVSDQKKMRPKREHQTYFFSKRTVNIKGEKLI